MGFHRNWDLLVGVPRGTFPILTLESKLFHVEHAPLWHAIARGKSQFHLFCESKLAPESAISGKGRLCAIARSRSASTLAAYLITPDATLGNGLATLDTGAKGIGIPYRMAECNSFYNGGASGVSDSNASTLWVIDYLYDSAQGGAVGVNFHGGGNGTGYTPIADSNGTVVGARPEYHGILFFTLPGQGTLYTASFQQQALTPRPTQ